MNEVFINALVNRIKTGDLTLAQIPIPYKEEVQKKSNPPKEDEIEN